MTKKDAEALFDQAWAAKKFDDAAYWAGVWRALDGTALMPDLAGELSPHNREYKIGYEDYA